MCIFGPRSDGYERSSRAGRPGTAQLGLLPCAICASDRRPRPQTPPTRRGYRKTTHSPAASTCRWDATMRGAARPRLRWDSRALEARSVALQSHRSARRQFGCLYPTASPPRSSAASDAPARRAALPDRLLRQRRRSWAVAPAAVSAPLESRTEPPAPGFSKRGSHRRFPRYGGPTSAARGLPPQNDHLLDNVDVTA